ncbi:MAG TPA: thiolase domain-containing protein [Acidimicrobiales bacterium]
MTGPAAPAADAARALTPRGTPRGRTRCAVVGVGQTRHAAARSDVTMAGLAREAALAALADAGLGWDAVDAVVLGTAPDTIEGVMSPELSMAPALGAVGKPTFRAYTSGNAGGQAATLGVGLVASGRFARVLVVAYEKQSEGRTGAVTLQHLPFEAPWQGGTGSLYGALCSDYIARSGAPPHIGDVAALKDRRNALRNPFAQVRRADVTLEAIAASRMLWSPIRLLHASPSSDGACAVVLAAEDAAAGCPDPAWVHGAATRSEPPVAPAHDFVDPRCGRDCAAAVYRQAGITDPRRELDVAELFVPFSWVEPPTLENVGLAEPGEGWRLVDDGATALDGALPVNPSGGLLGANPIGAAGLVRFAEAALQVRGAAGEHQIDGARLAVGHAQGGFSNFVAMWVVGRDKP